MTVPGRVAAAALLSSLDPPTWFVAHAPAVAEVAGFLAARIAANGIARRAAFASRDERVVAYSAAVAPYDVGRLAWTGAALRAAGSR